MGDKKNIIYLFINEVKRNFGNTISKVILYGSYAVFIKYEASHSSPTAVLHIGDMRIEIFEDNNI